MNAQRRCGYKREPLGIGITAAGLYYSRQLLIKGLLMSLENNATALQLLHIVQELLREMRQGAAPTLTLHSHFERDLALDSLGRTELLARVEQRFQVQLDERALLAETAHDLLQLLLQASGVAQAPTMPVSVSSSPTVNASPDTAQTLVEMLDWQVDAHPQRVAIHIYGAHEQIEDSFTYGSLQQGARALAAGLQARGVQVGETVAIMLPTGADYFLSFFGILYAGAVPVPIYPPARPSQVEEHTRRYARLLENAQVVALVTMPEAKLVARLLQAQVTSLRHVLTVSDLQESAGAWQAVALKTEDLAFLQYTSGSTGDPKGVMLSHANLLANLRAMQARIAATADDVFVSWLPLYHDMGLIGAALGSLYCSFPLVVMSPLTFLARPLRWLQAIQRHRGTLSAAPNFAYELCVRSIPEHQLEGLDLSSWRMALNGAEPVNPATLRRFIQRFSAYGFRSHAMAPVYGLAECSVGLALQAPQQEPVFDRVQRTLLAREGRALPAPAHTDDVLEIAHCGTALAAHQIRIVDAQGRELPDRREGRVEFQGPSATRGYYRNAAATARLFPHGDAWLDSGDRGYLADGGLYLTGRVKDLIIRGGRNIYPYELEQALGEIPGIRKGCVAAFASTDPATGSERLVVVAETRAQQPEALERLRQNVLNASVDALGIPPDVVELVAPRSVLKTSSGKIRRTAIRELYERGTLGSKQRALWQQLLVMAWRSTLGQVRKTWRSGGERLFAGYAWSVFALLTPPTWLGIMLLPQPAWRWRCGRMATRALAVLTATPLQVRGLEHLPQGPCILVANHASYLDVYVLMAAIPRHFHYVAKRELLDNRWIAKALQRIGTLFVERFDLQRSAEAGQEMVEAARSGKALAFFPEGTFKRMPGLLPFRMGAFVAAAQAGVPLVPVTIRGTRSILRAQSWFPRHGALEVVVDAPLFPDGADWAAALRLRDAARVVMLRHSGEVDADTGQ